MSTKNFFMTIVLVLGMNAAAIAARQTVNTATAAALLAACNAAAAGDTVWINPDLTGQTITSPNLPSKSLTYEGNGIILSSGGRIWNRLDGNYTFNNIKFIVSNSTAGQGAIMDVQSGNSNSVVFNYCTFENCTSGYRGIIGMCVNNFTYNYCIFRNNNGNSDGILYYCACGSNLNPSFTINNCYFENNTPKSVVISSGRTLICEGSNISSDALPCSNPDNQLLPNGDITWEIGRDNPSDVTATLSWSQKTLVISGSGEMKDFTTAPWASLWFAIYIVNIEGSVTSIGSNAFTNCIKLLQVRLPKSNVASIGANAFAGCAKLGHIFLTKDTPPSLDATAFQGLTKSNIGVFVPTPALYRANSDWSGFGIVNAYCEGCN